MLANAFKIISIKIIASKLPLPSLLKQFNDLNITNPIELHA